MGYPVGMDNPEKKPEVAVEQKLEELYPNKKCFKERLNELESTIRIVSDMAHKDKDCPLCYPKPTDKEQSIKSALHHTFCQDCSFLLHCNRGCNKFNKAVKQILELDKG